MKDFIINNIPYIIALVIFIFGLLHTIIKKPGQIKKWLINACIVAEQSLGSGTGQVKLHQVYNAFVAKYPYFSLFISFETFSKWVDEALEQIREWIENNDKIASLVQDDSVSLGETEETIEEATEEECDFVQESIFEDN